MRLRRVKGFVGGRDNLCAVSHRLGTRTSFWSWRPGAFSHLLGWPFSYRRSWDLSLVPWRSPSSVVQLPDLVSLRGKDHSPPECLGGGRDHCFHCVGSFGHSQHIYVYMYIHMYVNMHLDNPDTPVFAPGCGRGAQWYDGPPPSRAARAEICRRVEAGPEIMDISIHICLILYGWKSTILYTCICVFLYLLIYVHLIHLQIDIYIYIHGIV